MQAGEDPLSLEESNVNWAQAIAESSDSVQREHERRRGEITAPRFEIGKNYKKERNGN